MARQCHNLAGRELAEILSRCQARDEIVEGALSRYDESPWPGLRRQLTARGLTVLSFGPRFFIAPAGASPQLPLLRQLAAAAREDSAALAALKDALAEVWWDHPRGLPRVFVNACAASPGSHRKVPDGATQKPEHQTYAQRQVEELITLRRRTAGLSKLQRSLLQFALDYASDQDGAPLSLLSRAT
jgi:hypothetical protein